MKRYFYLMLLLSSCIFFCVASLSLSQKAYAKNVLQDEFWITSGGFLGTANNNRSAIAYNGTRDEYMVANDWQLDSDSSKFVSISRVSRNGSSKYLGKITESEGCETPDIAFDQFHNKYLVVWSQYNTGLSSWEIYGRLIDSDSRGSGAPFRIQPGIGSHLRYPKVAFGYNIALNSYVYMVVYQTESAIGGALGGLSAMVIESDGNILYPPFEIDAGPNIGSPDIAFNVAQAEFLTVWAEYGGASGIDIMGRRVGLDRSLTTPTFGVNTDIFDQQLPVITTNTQHRYLVLFQHDYYGNGTDLDVRGQFLDVTGAKVRSVFGVAYSGKNEKYPTVASNPNSEEYLAGWIQEDAVFGDIVQARPLNTNGDNFNTFAIATGDGGTNRYPAIGDGKKGYLITYAWDSFSPVQHGDIYGKLFIPKFPWILFQHLYTGK